MQASSRAFQSVSRIGMRVTVERAYGHDLKSVCYFLQFLLFDLGLSDLDIDQGH